MARDQPLWLSTRIGLPSSVKMARPQLSPGSTPTISLFVPQPPTLKN
ncbi:MAG: hypothetical protein QXI05_00040 [Candidatus Bathyarchaeia archaeon]